MPMVLTGSGAADIVLSGPILVAMIIAVAAGTVSFFSPCCLPLVPGYLSYVAGLAGSETHRADSNQVENHQADAAAVASSRPRSLPTVAVSDAKSATARSQRSRTVLGSVLFVAGFAAVFTSYGALFGTFGALLFQYQDTLIRALGVVTIALGLMFTGLLWRMPLAGRSYRPSIRPRAGLAGAPLVGAMFGLGWTPCIGPTLAAVLTLATSSADASRGALLSLAYSAGLGIPFIVAAMSVTKVMASFGWARRNARVVMLTGGAMLIVLGILQVSGAWLSIVAQLQGFVVGWQTPL